MWRCVAAWRVAAFGLSVVVPACGDSRSSSPGDPGGLPSGATSSAAPVPAAPTAGAAPSTSASTSVPATAATSLAGPPSAPGDPIPIPYARRFEIRPPRGWRAEVNGIKGFVVLRPPTGNAVVMIAGAEVGSAVALRELQFMDVSVTGAATFEPDKRGVPIGESELPADVAYGQGSRFLPNGKETHKLVRAFAPIRDSKGATRAWLTVFGRWNADEPELEAAVREAFRGIRLSP